MAVAITATEQTVWPVRILVTVTGLALGDLVSVYRSVSGQRAEVRGAVDVTATDPSLVRIDAELPFGVPVKYIAVVNDSDEYSTALVTHALVGGKVALTDAITGTAAEVVVTAWPSKRRERVASTFTVGGRNVVVSGALAPAVSEVELFTESDSSRANLVAVLENATAGVVQIRQAGAYPDVDAYLAVTAVTSERYSQDGTDPRRKWVLSCVETEDWATQLEAAGYTYGDVADAYLGQTYANLAGDYATYLAVAKGAFV